VRRRNVGLRTKQRRALRAAALLASPAQHRKLLTRRYRGAIGYVRLLKQHTSVCTSVRLSHSD